MFDKFQKEKKDFLSKKDKSRKAEVDKDIKVLVKRINSLDNFYTTSSCSGRIVLLQNSETGKKCDAKQLFVSHSKINYSDIASALKKGKQLWFRMEPFILHLCCKDLESLKSIVRKIRKSGVKRFGAIPSKKGFILEIIGSEKIETVVATENRCYEDYLKELVKIANAKLDVNKKKLKKLEKNITS